MLLVKWIHWIPLLCFVASIFAPTANGQEDENVLLGQLVIKASALEKQGKHQAALETYGKAEKLSRKLFGSKHKYVAAMLQSQGLMYRQLGQSEKGQPLIEECYKIAEVNNDRIFMAEALNNLANIQWDKSNFADAQEKYERSYKMMREYNGEESPVTAVGRNNLAGVYRSLGEYALAEPLYRQSIRVLSLHRDKYALPLADAMMNLAGLFTQQGDMARAEPLLTQSLAIKEQTFGPNHFEVSRTLNNLAALYTTLGQYPKSEAMYRRALQITEASLGPNHIDAARVVLNLAGVHQRLKQFDKADQFYQRALAIREKQLGPEHLDVALTLHNMAGLYVILKKYPQADEIYQRSLAIREKKLGADHIEVAESHVGIGSLRQQEGRVDDAEKEYQRALEIRAKLPEYHPDLAGTQHRLGILAAAAERWPDAVRYFDQSRRGFRRYANQVLPTLAESEQLTFLREIDEANYHAALTLVLRQPQLAELPETTVGWVLNGKAIVQETMAQRAILARDSTNPVMAAIAKKLLILRKQLASLSLVGGDSAQDAQRRQQMAAFSQAEQQSAQELARLGNRSPDAGRWTELSKIRETLGKEAILIEITRFTVYDFKDLRKEKEDLPQHYAGWVIPSAGEGQIKLVDLGDAAALDAAVAEARKALEQAPRQIRENGEPEAEEALKPILDKLSKLVLQPLLSVAGDRREIYLSPDSVLWLVPWSALPLADGKYAIEEYDLRLAVSGRDLVRNDGKFTPGPPVLFADPNYDLTPKEVQTATQQLYKGTGGFTAVQATSAGKFKLGRASRLPGTKAEANAVLPKLEAYAKGKAYVYTDQWALERVFKGMHQPKVLVLSTHGFFQEEQPTSKGRTKGTRSVEDDDDDDDAPPPPAAPAPAPALPAAPSSLLAASTVVNNPLLRCGLLLAGCNQPVDTTQGEGEDGILTGIEIVGTDLRGTELVVLSACETGLGEVRNGEGVAGLRQAFQLAGAKSVVSTLWQIPDRETARLMTDFFAGLAETGAKAKSLREAQLNLIRARRERNEAAHPFYWAAFTLTGE